MTLSALMDKIYPFNSSAVLLGAAFLSVFFGLSGKKQVKVFVMVITAIAFVSALFLNIQSFIIRGAFSNYLFIYGFLQMVQISIVLFISLNILVFISVNSIEKDNFIKILLIFIFTVFSLSLYIMSNNFLMIFSSLTVSVIGIFQFVTLLNSNGSDGNIKSIDEYSIRNYLIRYFLGAAFSILLVLVGFSLIFGSTDFKNFSQVLESEKIDSALFRTGFFIIFASLYFYLFIFPFQSAYIKLTKRCEASSVLVIWFLYFSSGIFLFLKLKAVLIYFAEKNNFYLTITFLTVAFLLTVGGNTGAVKTASPRRILAFLFLWSLGITVLSVACYSLGIFNETLMEWLIFSNMAVTLLCYLPVFAVFSEIEKKSGRDSIENIRGFARTNKYAGVNLIFLLLSFGGLIGTCGYLTRFIIIRTIVDYFKSVSASQGSYNNYVVMICTAAITTAAFGFLGANIIRIIVILLKNPELSQPDAGEFNQKKNGKIGLNLSRFHIIYITFYSILVLFLGIFGLFNILNINIGFTNFNITANITAFL